MTQNCCGEISIGIQYRCSSADRGQLKKTLRIEATLDIKHMHQNREIGYEQIKYEGENSHWDSYCGEIFGRVVKGGSSTFFRDFLISQKISSNYCRESSNSAQSTVKK